MQVLADFPRAFFMSARNPRSQGDWRGVLLIA